MGLYEPKVQRRGNLNTPGSFEDILGDMPATPDFKVFAPNDTPFSKEILPQEVVSCELPLNTYTDSSLD